ncbi:MAG: response regulator [Chloroflexota bacterium]
MVEGIHVLLVEDNPADVRLIQEMLLASPNERIFLNSVSTLADALARVEQNTYDAILLDLSLPDSSGINTLQRIRVPAFNTAIVVLTGMSDESVGIEAVQLGAQDYLPKDHVDRRLLIRSIRYAIERHSIEVALRHSEEEYRSLIDDVFETSMVAVLILDRAYNVVWCNQASEIYFGIGRERLLGRNKRQLIDSDLKYIFEDPDDYSTRLLRAYQDRSFSDRFECHVIAKGDRMDRWLEHWSQPIRGGLYNGGRIEQYTDITDRKRLQVAEQEQRKFAEALHDISTLLTSSLDLKTVLEHIMLSLDRVVAHDSAQISIIDGDYDQVVQHRSSDRSNPGDDVQMERKQLDYEPYARMMYQTGRYVIVGDLQAVEPLHSAARAAKVRAYMGAPIQLQDEVIGFINLLSEACDFFTDDHAQRLLAFTRLAAIAIQNARMFNQTRQLVTLRERQRLARELHDSVSQSLFTCRTMSEAAVRRLDKDPAQARALMESVNQLTTTALAEMRILLLELRPSSLVEVSLKHLFEQYLQPIQERREFDLRLAVEDFPPLPPDIQIALYRITQEALNNIDKHSQATQVVVRASGDADHLVLEIHDDGRGFDVNKVTPAQMGLGIMRERAQAIGASIEIGSELYGGTQIRVTWQREQQS